MHLLVSVLMLEIATITIPMTTLILVWPFFTLFSHDPAPSPGRPKASDPNKMSDKTKHRHYNEYNTAMVNHICMFVVRLNY